MVAVDETELRHVRPIPLRGGLAAQVTDGAVVTVTQHPGGRMKMSANQVLPLSLSASLSLSVSLCVSVCLSVFLSVSLSVRPSVRPSLLAPLINATVRTQKMALYSSPPS